MHPSATLEARSKLQPRKATVAPSGCTLGTVPLLKASTRHALGQILFGLDSTHQIILDWQSMDVGRVPGARGRDGRRRRRRNGRCGPKRRRRSGRVGRRFRRFGCRLVRGNGRVQCFIFRPLDAIRQLVCRRAELQERPLKLTFIKYKVQV